MTTAEAGVALGRALARLGRPGLEVEVMAFQPGLDLPACREMAGSLQRGVRAETGAAVRVTVTQAPPSPEEALDRLASWDLVVAVRLHALILAAMAGVPFVGVAYDPKVEAAGAELRWPIPPLAPEDGADVRAWEMRLRSALADRPVLVAHLQRLRPAMVAKAMGAVEAVRRAVLATEQQPPVPVPPGPVSPPRREPVRHAGALPPSGEVLGVPVHLLGLEEAASAIERWMAERDGSGEPGAQPVRHVVTLNPEMIMAARHDPGFRRVLEQADLLVPDGIGVVWACRRMGWPAVGRVPGIELAERCLAACAASGRPVVFVGGAPGQPAASRLPVAQQAALRLRQRLPGLRVVATHHGYFRPGSPEEEALLAAIEQARPALLLVGMGSPRQELWIARHRKRLAGAVRVAMGVGGSFDVWAGKTRRAPALARKAGLEWLWRLAREPRRAGRMRVLPLFAAHVLAARWGRHGRARAPNPAESARSTSNTSIMGEQGRSTRGPGSGEASA
ncbi:MAG: WecB/TagA/CpsF family glycosyltransferase [Limnochordaceae bacterium]|nr:WecB/TagA/CpsF family glycosyltransferase [Limnochordaceae bacterium]